VQEIHPRLGKVALDILKVARNGGLRSRFLSDSLSSPISPGLTHQDRVRVLDNLLDEGCLYITGDELHVVSNVLPSWLTAAAAQGYVDVEDVATLLIDDPEAREKFDYQILAQLGQRGELEFIKWARNALPGCTVRHVSLFDDSLGYDVQVEFKGRVWLFEVKSSTRSSQNFQFFISRNEVEVGFKFAAQWRIACVRFREGEVEILGTLAPGDLAPGLPADSGEMISWYTLKCSVPVYRLAPLDFSNQSS